MFFPFLGHVFPFNPCWCLRGCGDPTGLPVGLQVPMGREGGQSPAENQGLHWNIMARCGALGLVAPGAARTLPPFPEAGGGNFFMSVLLEPPPRQLIAYMAGVGKAAPRSLAGTSTHHGAVAHGEGTRSILHLLLPRGTQLTPPAEPSHPSRAG